MMTSTQSPNPTTVAVPRLALNQNREPTGTDTLLSTVPRGVWLGFPIEQTTLSLPGLGGGQARARDKGVNLFTMGHDELSGRDRRCCPTTFYSSSPRGSWVSRATNGEFPPNIYACTHAHSTWPAHIYSCSTRLSIASTCCWSPDRPHWCLGGERRTCVCTCVCVCVCVCD
jgi:hypothetical protein